jgi:hypothetical protein
VSRLPPKWREVTLADVALSLRNGIFAKRPNTEQRGTPILRISAVRDGLVDLADRRHVEDVMAVLAQRFAISEGDLLFTRYNGSRSLVGICGRVGPVDGSLLHPDKLIRVVPNRAVVDDRFLALQMQTDAVRRFLAPRIRTTAGQSGISGADVREIPVVLPPLDEQQRIVAVLENTLSRLDAGTDYLEAVRRRTKVAEQAHIDQLFINVAQRLRWRVEPLEGFATGPRAITDGPFGSNLTSAHYADSGALVVRLQNIGDGEFKDAGAFISLDHYEKLKAHDVRLGDVVVASLGDALPRAALVPDLGGPAIVKADCIRVRPDSDVDPRWLVYACRSRRAKRHAASVVKGVGRQRLGLKGIKSVPVPRAPLAEQQSRLAELESGLNALRRTAAQAGRATGRGEALRRALLDAAFAGQV